jgi:hypothetical protein
MYMLASRRRNEVDKTTLHYVPQDDVDAPTKTTNKNNTNGVTSQYNVDEVTLQFVPQEDIDAPTETTNKNNTKNKIKM